MSEFADNESIVERLLHLAEHLTLENTILLNALIHIAGLPSENGAVAQKQILAIFMETMSKIS